MKRNNIIHKIVIDRGYNDINPRECGSEICKPLHSFGPAVRSYWLLHFVVCGNGIFKTARGSYRLSSNDMFIIRPYEITYYEADKADPWKYIWLGFSSKIKLPSLISSHDSAYVPYAADIFKAAIEFDDDGAHSEGYEAFLCSKIWELIGRVQSRERFSGTSSELYIKQALNIMEAEFQNPLTVADVAARLHLDRSYFSTLFNRILKRSPHSYLTDLRMKRAAEMLLSDRYTVSVVASSVGYSDVFVFSRAFKSFFGVSPSEYRKLNEMN